MTKPLKELILRKYEPPSNLSPREACKRICLSLGLLQSDDSRETIVDIFQILLEAHQKNRELYLKDIKNMLIEKGISEGIAESNIRRHLRRLNEIGFVERVNKRYRFSQRELPSDRFRKYIKKYVISDILDRIEEYLIFTENIYKK